VRANRKWTWIVTVAVGEEGDEVLAVIQPSLIPLP